MGFFVLFKECSVVLQTSIFQSKILLFSVNYLVDNFMKILTYQIQNSNE